MQARAHEHVNNLIHLLGVETGKFTRREDRSALRSLLFNVPGRVVMSAISYYENLFPLLRQIVQEASPEEIGQRMKDLAILPNGVYLNMLPTGYLLGRQRRILQLGLRPGQHFPEDNLEGLAFVMDFWQRAARAYRNDGLLLPSQGGGTCPILGKEQVEALQAFLRQPTQEERKKVRRMLATVELYTFILHGESRFGIFSHGPYPLGGDQVLVVREMVGLRNDYYPWADTRAQVPISNVIRPMVLKGTKVLFDHVGSLITDPPDSAEAVVSEGLLTRAGSGLRQLSQKEVVEVTRQAAAALSELYVKMAEWPERQKTSYGATLYGYQLACFAEIAGVDGGLRRRIRDSFERSVDKNVGSLRNESEQGLLLKQTIGAEEPFSGYFPP